MKLIIPLKRKTPNGFNNTSIIRIIKIPDVYLERSSSRILTTERLFGLHIEEWLSTEPSQEERNRIGQIIFDNFLFCAFDLKALHADPHFGNYLFLDDGRVALIDFGCVKKLSETFPKAMSNIVGAILNDNLSDIFESYIALDLISPDLTFETYETILHPVLSAFQHWMTLPYQQDTFNFSDLPPPPMTDKKQHQEAVKYLQGVQRDQMYFDRTYIGIYQLLKKMKAEVHTQNPWLTH